MCSKRRHLPAKITDAPDVAGDVADQEGDKGHRRASANDGIPPDACVHSGFRLIAKVKKPNSGHRTSLVCLGVFRVKGKLKTAMKTESFKRDANSQRRRVCFLLLLFF